MPQRQTGGTFDEALFIGIASIRHPIVTDKSEAGDSVKHNRLGWNPVEDGAKELRGRA
jgi:hypothetical protein